MSWIIDSPLTYFQRFCINILKCGPIPKHIAFIMDGNRRYATKQNIKKAIGHARGFEKLSEALHWCRELGINEVTVYAFSIENFKRSPEEVEELLGLAREKYHKLLEEKDKLMEEGVCIRVIGNLDLIPEDLRKIIAQAVLMTKDNTKAFLNVAFAYTSRDEITNSIKTICKGIEEDLIDVNDINEDLINNCMYSSESPQPEMLIRTSGEVRFSDFLLWQIWNTNVIFTEILWPEFCIWHLLASVFQYQRCYEQMKLIETKKNYNYCVNDRVNRFLINVHEKRLKQLEIFAKV